MVSPQRSPPKRRSISPGPGSSDGANAAEKGAQVRHLVGQRLEGSVRSFRDSWGFVVSEAFQGDLYLHRRNNSELGPVQAGDPVSFQVLEDPPGHFQAVGCQVLPVPLAQLTGQRLFGWVKSFYPEDWGFLASLRFEGELFVSLGALAKQLRDVALAGEGTCDESRGHIK
ncbi:unnamed protein product [Cladocopium goreaui]|uniref:CSD domain-containing protein n=1 Tax=Cladocopium goreaui TaxID=2562237 RepID=A0A9P1BV83_9DINO|nr:unnamed protein product [Cladocopium goreaui]